MTPHFLNSSVSLFPQKYQAEKLNTNNNKKCFCAITEINYMLKYIKIKLS